MVLIIKNYILELADNYAADIDANNNDCYTIVFIYILLVY